MKGANDVREDKEVFRFSFELPLGCFGGFWSKLGRPRYVCALVLLVLAVFPATAYATSYKQSLAGVIQGPSQWYDYGDGTNGGYIGYFVYAYSDFDAALYTLDYDPDQLASEQKAKLSNASTGGKFYEYVQLFHTFGSDSEPSGWLSRDFYGQWVTMYGNDFLYWVEATNQQIVDAKYDLKRVLDGDDLGGGSGSGSTDGYYLYKGYCRYVTSPFYLYFGTKYNGVESNGQSSNPANMITNQVYVRLPADTVDDFLSGLGTGYEIENTAVQVECISANGTMSVSIFAGTSELDNIVLQNGNIGNLQYKYYYNNSRTLKFNTKSTSTYSIGLHNDCDAVTFNGLEYTGSANQTSMANFDRTATLVYDTGETVTPPTNWPTDPTPTPTEPPEVPEPPTTTPPTQPTPPTSPTPPTYPLQPVYVTSTFTADLQGIIDAMDEHCQHIQNALYQQSKNLYEDFTSYMSDKYADLKLVLDGNFGYIGDTIDDGFEDLKNYLWDLFKWLKRNMDFTFTSPEYDDSSILSWLKKIYSKMGTGMRSKPVDPVVDPTGAWDWLGQLIQGILGALSGAVGGLTGTVGELFDGIKEKFPFSIPWDLVAILALFDAAPVTPQATIDYTILEDGPISIPVHWDINLHYLDDTMGTIRAMEDIVFCFYLLLKTDWLSNVFDGIGDYLGGKLRTAMRS